MSQPPPSHPPEPQHPFRYTARLADEIETRWQAEWDHAKTYVSPNPGEPGFDPAAPKFYCLDMFPYPSGAGLHVGHPEGYTATDIVCRYKRMKGHRVLHPMGWDAFGLPAEQYAIQTGVHPAITTRKAIDNFRRQLKRFGFSYDWSREFGTIDEDYYRWTQWIFLKLYDAWYDENAAGSSDHALTQGTRGRGRPISDLVSLLERNELPPQVNPRADEAKPLAPVPASWAACTHEEQRRIIDSYRLAYLSTTTVNWCPKLGTVLANDEVIDGRSERGGFHVLRKPLKQWMFRITAYADRLLRQIDGLEWPESTRTMQREWIGRSEGAEIDFEACRLSDPAERVGSERRPADPESLRVFTTRPDTLFGATYMVVAPEHPLCAKALRDDTIPHSIRDVLNEYVNATRHRSDTERQENKVKTGVFTGLYARNPATGEAIPVWASDYVLMGYGTGAIMAVPAHDQRDFEFAQAFKLPIRDVVYPRAVLAMRHFTQHAYPDANIDGNWREELADYLGLTTSNARENEPPEVVLTLLRERRRQPDIAVDPPEAGTRRGSTRAVWLELLEELKVSSFADLRDRFDRHEYYASFGQAFGEPGIAANSANDAITLNGHTTAHARERMMDWLTSIGSGRRRVNYRLRDWTFSRQRYWGEPFPIVYDNAGRAYPVQESSLPVKLPDLADYAPIESDEPKPLLAKATEWVHTTAGAAGVNPALLDPATPVRRETNTMPGRAGSSWYAIRYCDARNPRRFVGEAPERAWMGPGADGGGWGVDLYLGGSEHAVGHLLYSRFWQNVLYDLGEVTTPEPFRKLFHQGLITSFAFQRADKSLVPVDEVEEKSEGVFVERKTGEVLRQIVAKMSKRLKNVVNPDDVIAEFGADTFRLYEMYMGPLEASKPWNPRDITGLFRFLQRLWRLVIDEQTGALREALVPDQSIERALHRVIAKVGGDIEAMSFNTPIAAMIEMVNLASSLDKPGNAAGVLTRDQMSRVALVVSPFAPHLAEELWRRAGNAGFAAAQPWPSHDPAMLVDSEIEVPVSVMGKVRSKVMVPAGADAKVLEAAALADTRIQELIAGKTIKKIIVVPGKMVNLVLG